MYFYSRTLLYQFYCNCCIKAETQEQIFPETREGWGRDAQRIGNCQIATSLLFSWKICNANCGAQQYCQGNNLKAVKAAGMTGHHLKQRTSSYEQGLGKHWKRLALECSSNGQMWCLGTGFRGRPGWVRLVIGLKDLGDTLLKDSMILWEIFTHSQSLMVENNIKAGVFWEAWIYWAGKCRTTCQYPFLNYFHSGNLN